MIRKAIYQLYTLITAVIIVASGAGLAWAMHEGVNKLPLRQYFSRSHTNAIWDWTNVLNRDQSSVDELSRFMYLHQLNTVYVNIGPYAALRDDSNKDTSVEQKQYEQRLNTYITTLHKRNITVMAAAGDVTWSNPLEWHKPLTVLHTVQAYNQSHPKAGFAGVEFDIEAYNQPGFDTGSITTKALVLTDYLNMIDALSTDCQSFITKTKQPLELGFAIPYWFDNENGNIPSVTWHGLTGPTLFHLLDRLNKLPHSNVVVMAYRNAARGNDGVISHSRTEIEYAQTKAPNVQVLIGQEVNDVEPAKITYFGESTTELSSQVRVIDGEFSRVHAYAGIAINDLAGLQIMESTSSR